MGVLDWKANSGGIGIYGTICLLYSMLLMFHLILITVMLFVFIIKICLQIKNKIKPIKLFYVSSVLLVLNILLNVSFAIYSLDNPITFFP
jgi:hypothetical protein